MLSFLDHVGQDTMGKESQPIVALPHGINEEISTFGFNPFDAPTRVVYGSAPQRPLTVRGLRLTPVPCFPERASARPRRRSLRIGERLHPISARSIIVCQDRIGDELKSQLSLCVLRHRPSTVGRGAWKVLSEIAATNCKQIPRKFGDAA